MRQVNILPKKLSTQRSQLYINLYFHLRAALYMKNFALAENLIKAGADIDFQTATYTQCSVRRIIFSAYWIC